MVLRGISGNLSWLSNWAVDINTQAKQNFNLKNKIKLKILTR